jgi:segregation and condensation protein B
MNETDLKLVIEATLLAAGRPVTTQQLLDLFDERERPTPEQLQAAMDLLVQDYATRGIELLEVASGWRIQVRPRFADMVSRLWQERPSRYSRALLETLALIAYRQPITRGEIEEIRGVSISSTIMRTLQERNWIRTVGHREVPGRPELLGTTREFLDYFGLKSLDQLPTLAELKDVETIGVQLELPSDEAPAAESAVAAEAGAGETAESNGEAAVASADADTETSDTDAESSGSSEGSGEGDESELSAAGEDADDDEDSDASPTMVASEDEDEDERGTIGDPPDERRED